MVVSQNWGYPFKGPNNKDCSILGSILGSPYFGKLPYRVNRDHWGYIGIILEIYIGIMEQKMETTKGI